MWTRPVHTFATCCLSQVDACQQHASLLLEDQPDNEDAALMLAEIMAHQVCCCPAGKAIQPKSDAYACCVTHIVQAVCGLLCRRPGRLQLRSGVSAACTMARP